MKLRKEVIALVGMALLIQMNFRFESKIKHKDINPNTESKSSAEDLPNSNKDIKEKGKPKRRYLHIMKNDELVQLSELVDEFENLNPSQTRHFRIDLSQDLIWYSEELKSEYKDELIKALKYSKDVKNMTTRQIKKFINNSQECNEIVNQYNLKREYIVELREYFYIKYHNDDKYLDTKLIEEVLSEL